jgi:hypothetical protein
LFDALKEFALIAIPRDPDIMIAEARKMAQQFPLSGLFPAVIVDDRGRTIAKEGMSQLGEPSRHAILRNESIYISLSVSGQIEVAREIIYSEKGLTESVLASLCKYSPFVPQHAVDMLAEGLFAFFQRDYPKAGAFVIPYLESCLRYVLEQQGEPSTVIKEGGVESNLMLSSLLGKHRSVLEQVIPNSYTFAIEAIFDDPLGESIRHRFAHGMLSRGHFFTPNMIYGIWLMYSLAILPMLGQWDEVEQAVTKELK